jgi:hypothetical protein
MSGRGVQGCDLPGDAGGGGGEGGGYGQKGGRCLAQHAAHLQERIGEGGRRGREWRLYGRVPVGVQGRAPGLSIPNQQAEATRTAKHAGQRW